MTPRDSRPVSPRLTIDSLYRQIYTELRTKTLVQVRNLVREHVERLSTRSTSYEFMNIYSTCSFAPPNVGVRSVHEQPVCKFTGASGGSHGTVVSIPGIISPLVSARVQHGQLDMAPCREHDAYRMAEEFIKFNIRRKMRIPKTPTANLGVTLATLENNFLMPVHGDLHELGCAYRTLLFAVELLYVNIIHLLHS